MDFMDEASSPQLAAWTLGGLKMRIGTALFSSVIVCGLLAIRMATAADGPPAWAYPLNNPDYKPPVDDGKPVRVPDSTAGYTWSQMRDRFIAPGWHPSDHGAPAGHRRERPQTGCARMRILSPRHRTRRSGKRRPCRTAEELHHPADGRLQEWRAWYGPPGANSAKANDRTF